MLDAATLGLFSRGTGEFTDDSIRKITEFYQAAIEQIRSADTWTLEEVQAHLLIVENLQKNELKTRPKIIGAGARAFENIEPAQAELKALFALRFLTRDGYDPQKLSQAEEQAITSAQTFADIKEGEVTLRREYAEWETAISHITNFFSQAAKILDSMAKAARRNMKKTCPACAEEPRVEATVCRFCGHRFETPEDRKVIQLATSVSEAAAITALQVTAGTIPFMALERRLLNGRK